LAAAFSGRIACKVVATVSAFSRQLKRDAIEAGLVDLWKHTNAKRSAHRKDSRPRRSSHDVEQQGTSPKVRLDDAVSGFPQELGSTKKSGKYFRGVHLTFHQVLMASRLANRKVS
jgi:hypothetical protein